MSDRLESGRLGRRAFVASVLGTLALAPPAVARAASTTGPDLETVDARVRPDDGVFEVIGHGWGHGRGMSQWGAATAGARGVSYRDILDFYYPNTRMETSVPPRPLRVRLSHDGSPIRVRGKGGLTLYWTAPGGSLRSQRLPRHRSNCRIRAWRVVATNGSMRVDAYYCGRWEQHLSASKVDGGGRIEFTSADDVLEVRRRGSSGATKRVYRGNLRLLRHDGQLRAINVVDYEEYLRAVVPSESMASWPRQALRAQAVAARSYARRSAQDRRDSYFDVYDSTSSQAYPGVRALDANWKPVREYEDSRTDRAIKDTRQQVVFVDHRAAYTEYGSSNGGWTADGGRIYLKAKQDDWDAAAEQNSRRDWSATVRASALENSYPAIGKLKKIEVHERVGGGRWGGRVSVLRLVGDSGDHVVRGEDSVRIALGVNSAYFAFVK